MAEITSLGGTVVRRYSLANALIVDALAGQAHAILDLPIRAAMDASVGRAAADAEADGAVDAGPADAGDATGAGDAGA